MKIAREAERAQKRAKKESDRAYAKSVREWERSARRGARASLAEDKARTKSLEKDAKQKAADRKKHLSDVKKTFSYGTVVEFFSLNSPRKVHPPKEVDYSIDREIAALKKMALAGELEASTERLNFDAFLYSGELRSVRGLEGFNLAKTLLVEIDRENGPEGFAAAVVDDDSDLFELVFSAGLYFQSGPVAAGESTKWQIAYRYLVKNYRGMTAEKFHSFGENESEFQKAFIRPRDRELFSFEDFLECRNRFESTVSRFCEVISNYSDRSRKMKLVG